MYDFESMHAKKVAQRQQRKKRMMLGLFTLTMMLMSFYLGWHRLWLSDYQSDRTQDPIPAPNIIATDSVQSNANRQATNIPASSMPVDNSKVVISVGLPKKVEVDTNINTSNNKSVD